MPANSKFPPNARVKVTSGAFTGRIGTLLDHQNPVDASGTPLPSTRPGYSWVMLSLDGHPFAAHLHETELEPA